MSMNDPLGDTITRIRNGQQARKPVVECLYSKLIASVCDVMKDEGFIRGYKEEDAGNNKKKILVELKYDEGQPVIQTMKRVSKPGRRVYSKIKELPPVSNGLGVSIISTPHGVMTDHKARQENVGGEVLCEVF